MRQRVWPVRLPVPIVLLVGAATGTALFFATLQLGADAPFTPIAQPTVPLATGPSGQAGEVELALPRSTSNEDVKIHGHFRLIPDALTDRPASPAAVLDIPTGQTELVSDHDAVRRSPLFREPSGVPAGFELDTIHGTRRGDTDLTAVTTYRHQAGGYVSIAWWRITELPIDVEYNAESEVMQTEPISVVGRQGVFQHPLPGLPAQLPRQLRLVDGDVLLIVDSIGLTDEQVLSIAVSSLR